MRNTLVGLVLAAVLLGGLFYAASHRAKRTAPGQRTEQGIRASDMKAIADAAAMINPGFVGLKRVGAWEVACSEQPVMIGSGKVISSGDQPASEETAKEEPKATEVPFSLGRHRKSGLDDIPPVPAMPKPAVTEEKAAATGQKPPEKASEKAEEKKISLGRCRATTAFRKKDDPKKVVLSVNFRIIGDLPGKLGLFIRMPVGKKGDTVVLKLNKGGFKLSVSGCGKAGCLAVGVLAPGSEKDLASATKGQLIFPPGNNGKREAVPLPLTGLSAALKAIRRAQS